ncbi:MAG: membrane protein insertase YidC [Pseudomonadota bacterium]|nr:membrane protein insertase YidC [Pseudomonadota bacterium]
MDQKRLFTAILISIAILLGYQLVAKRYLPQPPTPSRHTEQVQPETAQIGTGQTGTPTGATPAAGGPASGVPASPSAVPKNVPRLKISAPAVRGSISLLGARIDDVVLNDYRQTDARGSPDVQLLQPRSDSHPYYVQYGWSAPSDVSLKLPDDTTVWAGSASELTVGHPVTLSWDNGQGLTFRVVLGIDEHYMFSARQEVKNATGQPVKLYPWARIRRDYTPQTSGYYILFEGLLGVTNDRLQEYGYAKTRDDAKRKGSDVAFDETSTGGWAGMTDKYWLTAIVPDQAAAQTARFRYVPGAEGHFQVDYAAQQPQTIAPGAEAAMATHLFAGAKVVTLLDHYGSQYKIPQFDKAVDFGWFYFITKPIFYCLDYLNAALGNFGLAIIVFTVFVKALFFPLANYSYRSMSKMRLLSPKVTALRERLKDDPAKMQSEMMTLYRAEKVNPASGCLPMLLQIPVFFSLYKVIFVTIEMRQAPFFGWIHDLSQVDPTNVFTLFGLIPWDPTVISPLLHLGAWPLIMGFTMWGQQKLNPAPPDPVQAKVFQFMPVIFTFMLARFPAGLVIYWTWNNLLSVLQQWLIMRRTRLARPGLART